MKLRFKSAKSLEEPDAGIITYDELKLSKPIEKNIHRPKPLWEVLGDIHTALDENEIIFDQDVIHIDLTSAYNTVKEKDGANLGFNRKDPDSFKDWTFDNLYTKIIITDDLNELEGAITIAYNPYGMQISFGLTYDERAMFAHFGEEETIMSTTACGEIKVLPYFVMIHKVKQWCPFDNKNTIILLERTKALMNKSIEYDIIHPLIQQFYQYTKKYNDCLEANTIIDLPDFDRFIELLKDNAEAEFSKKDNISAWDLFTLGNSLLSPGSDIKLRGLIPTGYIWGGYIFSRLI